MGISAIGKDNSYLKWLQQQNGSTNSVMFRAQQNPAVDAEKTKAPAVDAEKMQTASVKPAEQTPALFGTYTIPGVEGVPAVQRPTYAKVSGTNGETTSAGYYAWGGGTMLPGDKPAGEVNRTPGDLYKDGKKHHYNMTYYC